MDCWPRFDTLGSPFGRRRMCCACTAALQGRNEKQKLNTSKDFCSNYSQVSRNVPRYAQDRPRHPKTGLRQAQDQPKTAPRQPQDMPRQPQDRPRRAPKPKESDVFPTCKLHETHGAKMTREPYCKDPNEPGWPQSLKKAMWRRPKKGPKQAQDS